MDRIRFERQYRTPYSEGYIMLDGEQRMGRLELHFTPSIVYCTMVVEQELPEDDILDLIQQTDDELVLSADVVREDFVVSVYHGRDIGTYSDDYFASEDESEEEDI